MYSIEPTHTQTHTGACEYTLPHMLFPADLPILIHNTLQLRPCGLPPSLFPSSPSSLSQLSLHLSLPLTPLFPPSPSPTSQVWCCSVILPALISCLQSSFSLHLVMCYCIIMSQASSNLFIEVRWLACPRMEGWLVDNRELTRDVGKDGEGKEECDDRHIRFQIWPSEVQACVLKEITPINECLLRNATNHRGSVCSILSSWKVLTMKCQPNCLRDVSLGRVAVLCCKISLVPVGRVWCSGTHFLSKIWH